MLKLVCVDDDKDVSEMMKIVGEQERVWTMSFTNGAEALPFLEENQVDVVLLDLAMPVLDGLTVAEEIRLNESNNPGRKRVKIAFLTGWPISETIHRVAERIGTEAIFTKPMDPNETIAKIKSWFSAAKIRNAV
jgi:CheY-like chemotaxis protein